MTTYLRKTFCLLILPIAFLSSCASHRTLDAQHATLANNGIQVIQRGSKVTIALASDEFFYFATPTIKPSHYPVLDKIASTIKQNARYPVWVRGYTDDVGSENRNREYAMQQAQSLVSYLWTQGIPAHCFESKGLGAQYPIADNMTVQGNRLNRHLEISFWTEKV